MTQTIQLHSLSEAEADRDLNRNKPKTENLLLLVFDSMSKIYQNLNRLNYMFKKKHRRILYHKCKGEKK